MVPLNVFLEIFKFYLNFPRTRIQLRVGAAILRHLDTNFGRTNFSMTRFSQQLRIQS